jgi:aldose 1-epimerase
LVVVLVAAFLVIVAGFGRAAAGADAPVPMGVRAEPFGKMPDGTTVDVYTLTSGRGLEARVMTLGATLTTVRVPDRAGKADVVTLHKPSLDGYVKGHPLFGSVVGRYANRIGNARFTIDGVEHKLDANAGKHHIHGGRPGFQGLVWKAEPVREEGRVGVRLTLTSPDGQGGFPGTVEATVVYSVTPENELAMDYSATTDKATHVNLTNHAYWNLDGAGEGAADVAGHVVRIDADRYVVGDADLIPTGELRTVEGTPLDFRAPRAIKSRLAEVEKQRYDHCYVLSGKADARGLRPAARVVAPGSGRVMEVLTTQPGVQFYTGNPKGLCLETQHFPDSPNRPAFPPTLLRPGETYRERTVHRFGVER